MIDKLRARLERDAIEYANPSGDAEAAKSMAVTNRVVSYLLGAHSILPLVEKLREALGAIAYFEGNRETPNVDISRNGAIKAYRNNIHMAKKALSYLEQWERGDGDGNK